MRQRKRLRQVVDSDLAADYEEEEDHSLQGYHRPSPEPSRPTGQHHHQDPMRMALAMGIIAAIIMAMVVMLFNIHAVITYGLWFLLGVAIVGVGVVAVREFGNHQRKSAETDVIRGQARAINARAKQMVNWVRLRPILRDHVRNQRET